MEKREYQDKGLVTLNELPMRSRNERWKWLGDKRVRNRFFSPDEIKKTLDDLVCIKCGKRCGGKCEQ
ncbi:MAG: hypothetical protein WCP87_06960 [Atribacterota bacterium]|nr:hypothetical protein [Candidatus Atribacteria bacterium]